MKKPTIRQPLNNFPQSSPRPDASFVGTIAPWLILVTLLVFPALCRAQSFATGRVDFGDGTSNVFSAADEGPDGKFHVLWKDGSFNTPPVSDPAAPTSLTATAGDGQVSVDFAAGADGGSAITNYEFSTNNGTDRTALNPAVATSPVVITGLTNGIAYSIRLRAVNAAGNGTSSDAASATPVDPPIVFRAAAKAAAKAAATTSISVSKLTNKAGGVLGTTVSVSSVAATSEQVAAVALVGSAIQYTPALIPITTHSIP